MQRKPIEITDDNWFSFAACRGLDPNLFVPERGVSRYEIADVKSVCDRCVVSVHCLRYALTLPEDPIGIWGGTSGRDRRKMRSAKAAKAG